MEKLIIKPIFPNFLKNDNSFIGEPNLSKKQSNVHYQGHYMKYIKKSKWKPELVNDD